jgi:hypothetical protein
MVDPFMPWAQGAGDHFATHKSAQGLFERHGSLPVVDKSRVMVTEIN